MTTALPVPSFGAMVTQWTLQPLALAAALTLAAWYVIAVRRRIKPWPVGRTVVFIAGLAGLVYATCGFPGAYVDSLFWMWTSQQLGLLLVVPYLIMAGQPLLLLGSRADRFLASGFVRTVGNPLVGPALVPLLSVVLFFGPLPRWAVDYPVVGWIEPLALVALGAVIVLPLVGATGPRSSLAIGLGLAIGSFELVLDAVPGIVLRLHRSVSTSYFDSRILHTWSPTAVHDQQIAGAVLWCVSELLDLPFLIIVFRQWMSADARDAAEIDTILEAERISRGAADAPEQDSRDEPWWVSDPAMQKRINRPY